MAESDNINWCNRDIVNKVCAETVQETENEIPNMNVNIDETTTSLQNIEISTRNSDHGMVVEDIVDQAQSYQVTYQPEQTQSTASLQSIEISTQNCDDRMVVEKTLNLGLEQTPSTSIEISTLNSDDSMAVEDNIDQKTYQPEQTTFTDCLKNIEISTNNSDDGMVVGDPVEQEAHKPDQETHQPEHTACGSEQIPSGLEQNPSGLEKTESGPEQTPSGPEQTIKPYSFENVFEVAKFNGPSENKKHFSGCKWSPDGTCLLTTSADYTLRLFDLPKDFYSKNSWNESEGTLLELVPSLKMIEGGIVYDYAWYPHMSSWDPLTCCFISTSSGSPIHLWDAYTGMIRATYRAYNYADEVHAALSVAFSMNGERIYSGFRDAVKVFDIAKPGRNCEILNLKTVSGQKGLVSCIVENPVMPELFAIGTYSKTIGLYTNSNEFVCLLTGQKSGITQIKFSNDGYKLFSGARVDHEIICWDIRNPGTVFDTFDRIVTTNQRIYFDLSLDNRYLISGGTDGICRIWDLHEESKLNSEGKVEPTHQFKAHDDCVNGVSLHKSYPIIATVSGQYHYPNLTEDDDDKIFNDDLSSTIENNLKLWWAGVINENEEIMNADV